MPRIAAVLFPLAAAAITLSGAAQEPESVLAGVAVLQQCTSAERGCVSGPENNLVAVRIQRGASAVAERTGPILMILGEADTIVAPSAPPPPPPQPDGELTRVLTRAGVTRADSVPTRRAVRAAPDAGAQPVAAVDDAPLPFARVYARRGAAAETPGVGVMVFDLTALRRHPRFEPTRSVRVIWPGADGRSYAVVVRVP